MHDHWRHQFLGLWSHLILRRPWTVLLLATAAVIACVAVTAWKLEFQPDRNDLISPSIPWNRTFVDWVNRFPSKHDLIVVIDAGQSSGPADAAARAKKATAFVEKLGPVVVKSPGIAEAEWSFPRSQFSPKTIRLAPLPQFERESAKLAEAKTLLASPYLSAMIRSIREQLKESDERKSAASVWHGQAESARHAREATTLVSTNHGHTAPSGGLPVPHDATAATEAQANAKIAADIDGLSALIRAARQRFLDEGPADLGTLVEAADAGPTVDYLTDDNRFFFIRITPITDTNSLNEYGTAIESMRSLVAQHSDEARQQGLDIGLTGVAVIETDETDVATTDSTIASIVSVVLIYALLWLAFYSLRTPLLATVALLVAIAWAYGYTTLRVGHLQVISVVFNVMLLSLGIAYGIHIISRFELVRHNYAAGLGGFTSAMRDTIETVGPGVFIGAVTTSAAFMTTLFTKFTGVAEMGEIAAVGIMLCLLSMFTVFPALLSLVKPKAKSVRPMENRDVNLFSERWLKPFWQFPKVTVVITAALVALSLWGASRLHFDFDLLKLFPTGVESVEWQNRMAQTTPIYVGVSVCDSVDDARAKAAALRDKTTVKSFRGIGLLFPDDDEVKLSRLQAIRKQLQPALDAAAAPASLSPRDDLLAELRALQFAVAGSALVDMPAAIRAAMNRLGQSLSEAIAAFDSASAPQREAGLRRLAGEFHQWRQHTRQRILSALDTSPLTPADLPPALLAPYIDPIEGKVSLEIIPDLPPGVGSALDPSFLRQYFNDMASVDPDVTGVASQIFRSGVLMKTSYELAGLYALGIVFLLVYLDFFKLTDSLLSLLPVAVGFALTFGLMYLIDMQINPANIIVLPLMFGIGVDAGVHMLHRYRQSPTTRPLGLSDGTGKGITITNLASVVGFSTLLLGRHRGVQGLGFVLAVGIALTTLACWTVMRAVLELRQRFRERHRVTGQE